MGQHRMMRRRKLTEDALLGVKSGFVRLQFGDQLLRP